jgi:hypothetical protein
MTPLWLFTNEEEAGKYQVWFIPSYLVINIIVISETSGSSKYARNISIPVP